MSSELQTNNPLSPDWADQIAQKLITDRLLKPGICLVLGASDTGKTSLVTALAKLAASNQPVAVVDADVGQSHIGPPTTVGWAVVNSDQTNFEDLSSLPVGGISFVGDVTPARHLLQFTAAISQCVSQASQTAKLIIIDTPGFILGSAAEALWWQVQRIIKPNLILAVQRSDEIGHILSGMRRLDLKTESVRCPPQVPLKQPPDRRDYRQAQFEKYFKESRLYQISLNDTAIQSACPPNGSNLINRIASIRGENEIDIAVGIICDWQPDKNLIVVKAPPLDVRLICCLVIGDITVEISGG
jgi:polynucleotide 5'-hydroxyl-kinase GRC3/NOL9